MLFVRRETFREFLSLYPITSLIVFLNTIMMIVTILFGWFSNDEWIYSWGGLTKESVIDGELYRLLTYSFLHSGMMHFLSNMVFTIIAAPAIEKLIGKMKFITLFFFSIFMAALAVILIPTAPYYLNVGESGFGYSLFGFYFYLVLFKKNVIDKESSKTIMVFIAVSWITTLIIPNISISAHIGGFIAGWLYAFFINKSLTRLKAMNSNSYYR
ncbi:rhomboid family intramembrane serine protease [Peribacillus cavernae]|uniref:Rhomboid family intramembrane serine protease n=1 Tax=Peribacillus cavernae TaxID=1674310 RepID=A0A3S0W8H2_9BACI|nr:rhomboid family intramembrane serine protease [Peribacillus cavernae]MDQ0217653.1 rhomboid protease GluP [Peribacillus cavernae]RUQ29922.1 rhomboid family intramembrane serine protease [Peribacillus cavernae]